MLANKHVVTSEDLHKHVGHQFLLVHIAMILNGENDGVAGKDRNEDNGKGCWVQERGGEGEREGGRNGSQS